MIFNTIEFSYLNILIYISFINRILLFELYCLFRLSSIVFYHNENLIEINIGQYCLG